MRPLSASDVEVRVGQCNGRGVSLLLYKDARCDMRMLDEEYGAENWQCAYERIGDVLFCKVGVYLAWKDDWVWKMDCGTKSNMEADKGEASDAFKRACFRWGIGRELYTAPFIWVTDCAIKEGRNGNKVCHDRFSVESMEVEGGKIVALNVRNDTAGKTVFRWKASSRPGKAAERPQEARVGEDPDKEARQASKARLWAAIKRFAAAPGSTEQKVLDGVKRRPDWQESAEWFEAVALELEEACDGN